MTGIDVARYEESGVLFPIPVLSDAERQRFRSDVEELEAQFAARAKPTYFGQCHLNFRWAYELCTHARVLDAVEQILGPDILVHSTTLFSKHPGGKFVSWHQDSFYWRLSEPSLVSAWIALSDSTIENGCLRVQPGTHRQQLEHVSVKSADNMLDTGTTVNVQYDEARAVDVVLRAGEMSLHHANLVHGSKPNRSTGKRVGFAVRYVAPHVRQGRAHHEVVLARGRDRYGHYDVLAEPPGHSVAEGMAVHISYSERLRRRDLDGLAARHG